MARSAPGQVPRGWAAHCGSRGREAGLEFRGQDHSDHRAQCGGRKGPQGLRRRACQLRRDAPGLLRRHRPTCRHGSRRGARPDVLSLLSGLRRRHVLLRGRQGACRRVCGGLERLHPRRVVCRCTGSVHPHDDGPLLGRAGLRGRGRAHGRQGCQGHHLHRGSASAGPAVVPQRPLGSVPLRRPGRRHALVPALRFWRGARGRPRRQLCRGHCPLRHELAIHHRGPVAVPGLSQLPASARRALRRGHRVDSLCARTG